MFNFLHVRELDVIQCCDVGKREEEIIEKCSLRSRRRKGWGIRKKGKREGGMIACVPVVSWILITKKGHDDGNHYFNI